MQFFDLERARRLMRDARVDALVAWGGANFHYLSGFQNYFDNPGASIAVLPLDGTPFLLVAEWVVDAARASTWIDEIHSFPLWLEILDREVMDRGPLDRPVRYDLASNVALLATILEGRGLAAARIGIERSAVSASAFEMLGEALPSATWLEASQLFFDLRSRKHPEEVRLIERATRYAEHGLRALAAEDLVGADVARLRALYDRACVELALSQRDGGFQGIRVTAAVGREISPRLSGCARAARGDLVFFDCGALVEGYGSDTGRTLTLGEPAEQDRRLLAALRDGVEAALERIRPGVPMCEVFEAGQEAVRRAGIAGYSRGHVGHSMGIGSGEMPPFLSPRESRPLEKSMVLAIETPLYVRGVGGFQIEECVEVTADGCRLLTTLPRDFLQVAVA